MWNWKQMKHIYKMWNNQHWWFDDNKFSISVSFLYISFVKYIAIYCENFTHLSCIKIHHNMILFLNDILHCLLTAEWLAKFQYCVAAHSYMYVTTVLSILQIWHGKYLPSQSETIENHQRKITASSIVIFHVYSWWSMIIGL